jgi:hypothetical protein
LIAQPFALSAFDGAFGARIIVGAQSNAVVHPEIKFGQIAGQVALASPKVRKASA